MPIQFHYLPYSDTGYFSSLVNDYLNQSETLKPFYTFSPDVNGMQQAIEARSKYPVDRNTLVSVLQKQYEQLPVYEAVQQNIALLANENTFTVCTAHQPNLMTGYLYFIYKIVHAIKLAEVLKEQYPEKNFVPVYYMGSEDNDLEELGTFQYESHKFVWEAGGQTGAVGRMGTESLKPLIADLFKLLGPPGKNLDALKEIIEQSYLQHRTIADATQYLVNELFGRYGLVVLNPDEAALKKNYIAIMKEDLLLHTANTIVSEQVAQLGEHYKIQAHPRPINLFYLNDQLRERIEKADGYWHVLNTDIRWNEKELMAEMEAYPERFSPNVILRGMFQETILPDVAFIGGSAEVAYWLQLKTLFDHYEVFFPVIHLRQSVLWVDTPEERLRCQLQFSIPDIFKSELDLIRAYITTHGEGDWQTGSESHAIEAILGELKQKATALDVTLKASSEAVIAKVKYQLQVLEKKMLRAEKRKMQTQLLKITRLKENLFPKRGLQERVGNFMPWFLNYGYEYFDVLKAAMHPFDPQFLVIVHSNL